MPITHLFTSVVVLFTFAASANCDVDCKTFKKPKAMQLKFVKQSLSEKIALLRTEYPNLTEDQVADVMQVYLRTEVARGFRMPKIVDVGVDYSGNNTHPNLEDGSGSHVAGIIAMDQDPKGLLSEEQIRAVRNLRPELSFAEMEAIARLME